VRAGIRRFTSLEGDIEVYVSPDPHDDACWLRMIIGPLGERGEESFDLLVCTPAWLARILPEQGPQIGRHRLIVESLDMAKAQAFLRDRIQRLEAPTWPELAEKISRLGHWEFEDYTPYKGPTL
jgi:hypothetical protein